MDMSPVHQVLLKPPWKAQWKGEDVNGQKKTWEGSIWEWTWLEWTKSQRAVENGQKWRKLAVKSSVVHQRSPRLRVRWRWFWRRTTSGPSEERKLKTTNYSAIGSSGVYFQRTRFGICFLCFTREEGGAERERDNRQKDRQTDREKDRQAGRQADRQNQAVGMYQYNLRS